ncbi:MAG TPA: hypothetical protein VFK05_03860 [Polyangiaceae bacterium]|nr:hypothetical protein [Polyangiaceae bacterium]
MTEPVTGSILAGEYRVDRVQGRGGMEVVVLARHWVLDEWVAIEPLPALPALDHLRASTQVGPGGLWVRGSW